MNYPLVSEYIDALRCAEDNLNELSNLRLVLNEDGSPVLNNGNFAVVFKMTDGTKFYALKCFTKEQEGRTQAYQEIIHFIGADKPKYFVEFHYKEKELFVDTKQTTETEFPVLVMEWVDGEPLNTYIMKNADYKLALQNVYENFSKIAVDLLYRPFAHGDIKPDNIIVKNDGEIVLVDYDGMYVPSMYGQQAREIGTPDYQNPNRSFTDFDEHIDDYALIIICLCLRAIVIDNLLFSNIFNNVSSTLKKISEYRSDLQLTKLYGTYLIILSTGRLDRSKVNLLVGGDNEHDYNYEKDLLHKANQGNVLAMKLLGDLYYNGNIVPKDIGKAQQWHNIAYTLGNVDAVCGLCNCFYHGILSHLSMRDRLEMLKTLVEKDVAFAACRIGEIFQNKENNAICDFTEAVRWYSKAAEMGYANAQYSLAFCYYNGHGVKQDYENAMKWFRKSAEQDFSEAQFKLGDCYFFGYGVQPDWVEAVKWYKKSAEQGSQRGQRRLGDCFFLGEGVQQDYAKAIIWYKKSTEHGDAIAQFKLGSCYYFGQGINQDYIEAAKLYKKSAEQGNSEGQFRLGNCYRFGEGVLQNYMEAVKWYKKSAEQRNSNGQLGLGSCYMCGEGVKKDQVEAIKWYTESANQGNSSAQWRLGDCYRLGKGVLQDYVEAAKWYKKSAEQGNSDGQWKLGDCYILGFGVRQDNSIAMNWYKKSANQDNSNGQWRLGICYYFGQGTQQNHTEAVIWYEKSAEQGNSVGQWRLGDCYKSGKGVMQDHMVAAKCYTESAKQGDCIGQLRLGDCYYNGQGTLQDYKEAAKWYEKSAEQGNSDGQWKLGDCYKFGHGVCQDYYTAIKWYTESAKQGNPFGEERLNELPF